MKKLLLFLIAALLLPACTPDESKFKSDVPISRPSFEDRVTESEPEAPMATLPDAINLDVPFYPQAPDADWSYPWQEVCEEASITLAYHYFSDEDLSKEEFKKNILGLVDWQNEHFGDYEHSSIDQTAQMLRDYFGFHNLRIIDDPSVEDIKKELAMGNIIVAPFAGRMLGNPFYSGEGPYYHMMVIKGYDQTNFITNDVGTKRGLNFIYPYQTIMSALHDYRKTDIHLGAKKVIVLVSSAKSETQ